MGTLEEIIRDIRSTAQKCYLDTGAMSLMPKTVFEAVEDFHESRRRNGPSFAEYWKEVDTLRSRTAQLIGSAPEEIMFLQNTSMGINLAAKAVDLKVGDNVVVTNIEFPSNIYPWMNLESQGVEVRMIDISDGRLDEEKLAKICDEKTKVLSISWVQALNGMVANLQMCSEFCQTHDIVFVVDAIQGLGVLPIDVKKVHIDFLVSGFFKWLLGPDGIAFVYINQEILGNLNNPFIGWAGMKNKFDYTTYKFDLLLEARRYETGNMNFSGIFGARQGVEIILEHQEEIGEKVQNLTQYLRDAVQKLDGAEVLSPAEGEMAGITLIGCRDSKQKYELLQKKGITVNYRNGIRVSLHFYNTTEDIDCFLGTIR